MKIMVAEVYDALKEAGASEEKSRAAAVAVVSFENRFAGIEHKLFILTVQVNIIIAGVLGLVMKAFFFTR